MAEVLEGYVLEIRHIQRETCYSSKPKSFKAALCELIVMLLMAGWIAFDQRRNAL
jgi:hypothetical protein